MTPEPPAAPAAEKRMVVARKTFTHPSGHVVLLIYKGDLFDVDSKMGRVLTGHYPTFFEPAEVQAFVYLHEAGAMVIEEGSQWPIHSDLVQLHPKRRSFARASRRTQHASTVSPPAPRHS